MAERGIYGALAALLNERLITPGVGGQPSARPRRPTESIGDFLTRGLAPFVRRSASPTFGQILALDASHVPAPFTKIPLGTGQALRNAFKHGGWAAVQGALVWRPWARRPLGNARSEMLWRVALTEALVFDRAGFDLGKCRHGDHWYVRKDVRQMDCPRHKRAGQQARWRAWKLRQARAPRG